MTIVVENSHLFILVCGGYHISGEFVTICLECKVMFFLFSNVKATKHYLAGDHFIFESQGYDKMNAGGSTDRCFCFGRIFS